MHYAIPRMLQEAGVLEHFYTDICAVKGFPRLLQAIPQPLRTAGISRLLGRVPEGIPPEKITAFTSFGWEYSQKLRQARSPAETISTFLWAGETFCHLILRQGLDNASGVYTFNSAGLELLQAARARKLKTVMEQTIAPIEIESKLMQQEHQAFPGWATPLLDNPLLEEFASRTRHEWNIADTIFCGSEFVRDGIIACGGPGDRCQVLPYGVDIRRFSLPERQPHPGPLRVLTVGQVGLRKGSPYVLGAAQRLKGLAVFRLAGSIGILPGVQSLLADSLELIGPVPRSEILAQIAWADVFLLPSHCEGSATVIYEALAAGLPVICTPNAGSVVRDGIDGFIVPIRDPDAIAEKVELLATDLNLRAKMSSNALQRASEYTLDSYQQRLLDLLAKV
jgi:hypothetical protein